MSRQTINMAAYADVGTNADYSLTYISKYAKRAIDWHNTKNSGKQSMKMRTGARLQSLYAYRVRVTA